MRASHTTHTKNNNKQHYTSNQAILADDSCPAFMCSMFRSSVCPKQNHADDGLLKNKATTLTRKKRAEEENRDGI